MTLATACPKPAPREKAKRKPIARQSLRQLSRHPKAQHSTIVKKSAKPKARSKTRDRNDPKRIYGPPAFVAFLHGHECLGCSTSEAIQQSHLRNGGTGRKDSWKRTVPLCGDRVSVYGPLSYDVIQGCHQQYDGAKKSWAEANNLPALAAQFWNRWLLNCGRLGLDPHTGKVSGAGAGRRDRGGAE